MTKRAHGFALCSLVTGDALQIIVCGLELLVEPIKMLHDGNWDSLDVLNSMRWTAMMKVCC